MFSTEKASRRLLRVIFGIAIGLLITLAYASYLMLSNSIGDNTSINSTELELIPINASQK